MAADLEGADTSAVEESRKPDPRSVLLVDDSREIRQVLRVLFENNGFEVVGEADSGVGVVEMVLQRNPAFVILDMRMPDLSGEQTAQAIRRSAPDTHIVAFSAFLEEQPEWADAFLN
ncbi:MAG: response regulator transcription factor, partial [Actinomycetota bacterium]